MFLIFAAYVWFSWVGANDRAVEGDYEWTDGTPFAGTWGSGTPISWNDYDCVTMEKEYNFDFNNKLCDNRYQFLCQIRIP